MGFRLVMKILDNKQHISSSQLRVEKGFSLLEALIVVAIVAVLAAMGVLGITRARASMRLSAAAREYAAYIEKVRVFSIRRHADTLGQAASVTINDDRTSYTVTFDFDGDGTMETRTFQLPAGVSFQTVEAIAFDWRGRTWNTVGGVTLEDAQVSITLSNGTDSVSVDVTGAGDVTIDSRVFDDAVPSVALNVADLATGATPTPTPASESLPSESATPTPSETDPTPTPTPGLDTDPTPTPTPIAEESPLSDPSPSPSPTESVTPTPSPTPVVTCVITVAPTSVTMSQDGTTTTQVSHNSSSSLTITAVSSKPSDLQATPGFLVVAANGSASFTLKAKKSSGSYSVKFTASCGELVVPVKIE